MTSKSIARRLLGTTFIAGVVLTCAPAFAQTAPASSATPAGSDPGASITPAGVNGGDQTGNNAIVVTGSRIPQPNLTSASPVTVLNSQAAKLQGTTRIEDLINTLPQAFASQGSAVSNGSSGTATVNLRNLGDQRTLVLVNGRRLMPGDPTSPTADLNFIPTALVKRVDVLTGGASSVYGSDAVAGVVNFILDTDFTGFGVDTQYGLYQHDNRDRYSQQLNAAAGYSAPSGNSANGHTIDANVKLGAGFDDNRGHVVAYFGYRKISAVDQSTRDYSNCGLSALSTGGYTCSGSATSFPAVLNLVSGGRYQVAPNGGLTRNVALFNANPYNYYQRPDERYTAGFFGHYDVADFFKPYAEFGFMADHTNAVIAPSGDFSNTTTINCNNPYLSATQSAVLCAPGNLVLNDPSNNASGAATFRNPDGTLYNKANVAIGRRNVEGGGRDADIRHTDFRIVLGTKGDVAKGLSYDAYFQYGETQYNLIYRNEFSVSRLNNAIDVISDANGNPACRAAITGADANCVPVNFFSSDPLSAAALNYLQVPGFQNGDNKETVVNASLTFLGDEYGLRSPFADHGLGLNFGAEYRRESLRLEVDNEFATGDLAGQGGPTLPLSGAFNVREVFVEAQLPLVEDKPFFHSLSVDGGFRYSDYSTSGSVESYKGQLTWAPIRDITFRGGYNRAVRAANVQELFQAQSVQIDGSTDPCAGTNPTFSAAQCVNLGVPTSRYGSILDNPSQQYNGLVGGNPQLKPETADTYTVGVILQPSFLRGFSASVDAFSIKVKNLIGTVGADVILQQCGLTGAAEFCNRVHRDQFGTLFLTSNGYVEDTNLNAGFLKTRGIDTNVSYNYRSSRWGTFGLSMVGTYLDEFRRNVVPADYDCAGFFGGTCGTPAPKWRHTARLSWTSPADIGLSLNWRFFGKVRYDKTSSQPDLAGSYGPSDARIGAQSYFDLVATTRVGDHLDMRLGVNNIADKKPPILSQAAAPIGSFGNGNTYPTVYDALGRYIFLGLSVNY
ncbi:TonB-dependent receptor domain-containing protein [Sphingomonas morindae]|uniref:TonB-dependent receptor n=1 Tax=Sphingomonas morindae TaxID=1541170 RepID=A0ABY4X8Y1_9SPHN|nr:TonB-dependent receptor [Sphingomonas morindae]USI73324.1 TonB-dependent receptor [Sphingomonas morindae]